MRIYIMRHGDANQNIFEDRIRPLSELGVQAVSRVGNYLKLQNVKIDLIITSPFLRTYQTAEIISKIFNIEDKIEESNKLLIESCPNEIISDLSKKNVENGILLVGHQPSVGNLISHLTNGKQVNITMGKAALACIEIDHSLRQNNGVLKWMINPDDLNN